MFTALDTAYNLLAVMTNYDYVLSTDCQQIFTFGTAMLQVTYSTKL